MIKPCPFCTSTNVEAEYDPVKKHSFIVCLDCEAQGPHICGESPENTHFNLAEKDWNWRPYEDD